MRLLAPLINDIATDLDDPPQYRVAGHGPMSERAKSSVRRSYPGLAPLRSDRPLAEVMGVAESVARSQLGWKVHLVDREQGFIEAMAVTPVLRFKDDVAVRLRAQDGSTIVDVRSASRVGKGDFGANAERIQQYLRRLSTALAT